MHRTQLKASAILAAALVSGSCFKHSASDQTLLTAIQSKLYADDSTRASSIKVDVKGGVVTLSGDVPTSDVELEAMKVANGTPGVSSVSDQMKVNTAAAAPTQLPDAGSASPTQTASSYPPASAPTPPPVQAPVRAPRASSAPVEPAAASSPDLSSTAPSYPPPSAPARPREPATLTIPAGERLQVRMIDGIDSRTNSAGQTFRASLDSPLIAGNRVAIPAGAPVTVSLVNSSSAGRIKGSSSLEVRAINLTAQGQTYDVSSNVYDEAGKGKGKQSAVRTGIGAAAGALIGGLAGGGKGAAIGAGAGGGAGLGYQFFTHGSQVKIPSESVLTFRLAAPLIVRR